MKTIYVALDEEFNVIKKIVCNDTIYININFIKQKSTTTINHLLMP